MIDFNLVDAIDAEAIGVPGERTFRLRIRAGNNRASLWMEKEQLAEIGRALSQILAELSQARGRAEGPAPSVGDFADPDVDFRIARLGLDFQPEKQHIVLLADDREALESGGSTRSHGAVRAQGPAAFLRENYARSPTHRLEPGRPNRPWCALCHSPHQDERIIR